VKLFYFETAQKRQSFQLVVADIDSSERRHNVPGEGLYLIVRNIQFFKLLQINI